MTRIQITILVVLGVITWCILRWIYGYTTTMEEFAFLGITSFLVYIFYKIFDVWGWKCVIFYPWFVNRPSITGTWRIDINSNFNSSTKVTGYASINQTLTTLKINIFTLESSSKSLSSIICNNDSGTYTLTYTYQNDPDLHLRGQRSEIHPGVVIANITSRLPNSFSGEYTTYRDTKGTIHFTKISSQNIHTFAQGQTIDTSKN